MIASNKAYLEQIQINSVADFKEYEDSAGVEVSQKSVAVPGVPIPVSNENDITSISTVHSHGEDGLLLETEHPCGPVESKSLTESTNYREEEIPVLQSHKAGTSDARLRRILGGEGPKAVQLYQSYKGSSWSQKLWMWWMTGSRFIIHLLDTAKKLLRSTGAFDQLIIILLLFGKVCSARGGSEAIIGDVLPFSIQLLCNVSFSNQATWLCGRKTVVKNVAENQNLIIGPEDLNKNCVCEMNLPSGDLESHHFPMPVFRSCAVEENNDYAAFKGGRVCMAVELEGIVAGTGNVDQAHYVMCMKNNSMEISPGNGSDHQLQLNTDIKCNIKYKGIEMIPSTNASTGQVSNNVAANNGDRDDMVVIILVAVGVTSVIFVSIVIWFILKQWHHKEIPKQDEETIGTQDKTTAKPATCSIELNPLLIQQSVIQGQN